ncbi:hypothetical protein [Halobiforma nitratireducens]|uniref:Uncharacterized protein n=1 Tax=Halobiforma nitratireducens JCM 10879 TaxID=1227454 RepID=M0MIP3_9EURY|nr:hypothetical protein [Halobiforma nitratireducens]EMA45233.1 hypothetical protein C446_02467 [Halobiforma nitratireducens JCM 10879]
MSALLTLLAVVVLALIVAYWFPDLTRRWLANIMVAKRIVFAAVGLIVAFVLLGTGVWYLVLIGALALAISVWRGYFQFYRGEEVT